jgi:hypothetical protein
MENALTLNQYLRMGSCSFSSNCRYHPWRGPVLLAFNCQTIYSVGQKQNFTLQYLVLERIYMLAQLSVLIGD